MEETYYEDGYVDPGFIFTLIAVSGVIALIAIVANWRIYQKAGQPGWASIVPFYNLYILLKVVGKPTWWLLLLLIPGVNIIFAVWTVNMLSRSFGKDVGFTLGLLFLPFIFYPVLGFGSAQYVGPYGDPAAFAAYQQQHNFEFEKTTPH